MDFYKDKRFMFIFLAFLAFAVGIVMIGGWLLILALLFFGFTSFAWKESHIKLSGMCFLVLLALISIFVNGLNFGIDFVGGTRIPVILDHSVDQATMADLVQNIKSRASTLGLKEVKAEAIGDNVVNVEIASTDEQTIAFIENSLSEQGVYQGIVDGKVAVTGDHMFRTSIQPLTPQELAQQHADWGVAFSVDNEGADMFAQAAKNKGDYPIYMFIDRPQDAAIFYNESTFKSYIPPDSGEREAINAMNDSLKLEGGMDIPMYFVGNLPANLTAKDNKTEAIIDENVSAAVKADLQARGFKVVTFNSTEMQPNFQRTGAGVLYLNELDSVGLLSGPILGGGITSGVPNYNYVVTGTVQETDPNLRTQDAANKVKNIESILKGGALPVQITLGSRTTLPASLGSQFLRLSVIAIIVSLIIVSLLIGLRYRNFRATWPIVLISLAELVVLMAILGSFTIDLPAMAGIIAAIGVGVDAQIVITDELLKQDTHTTHEKVELAFGIIRTNAIVAIFSMLPLLFSGLVEIIGFAMSTILGALLGYMLTRPAYAALMEKTLDSERKGKKPAEEKKSL